MTSRRAAVKKTRREGQQHRLRDKLRSARTALARVLADLGTHVAQKLPGLAKVLDDAGIGFRGSSGHQDQWLLSEAGATTRDGTTEKLLPFLFALHATTSHEILLSHGIPVNVRLESE